MLPSPDHQKANSDSLPQLGWYYSQAGIVHRQQTVSSVWINYQRYSRRDLSQHAASLWRQDYDLDPVSRHL